MENLGFDNKAVLQHVFEESAKGNGRPFMDMLADDVRWEIIGTTDWSRTFVGKPAVISELLRPLAAQFSGPNTVCATRFIADGDLVAIEGVNKSTTKNGSAYPNRYCWIFRMRDGKAVEVTEYCDTQLIDDVLSYPH